MHVAKCPNFKLRLSDRCTFQLKRWYTVGFFVMRSLILVYSVLFFQTSQSYGKGTYLLKK